VSRVNEILAKCELYNMKIKPIAFDSFGARSMCTVVETKDVKIVIDPSVALAPKRYGLPPHEIEIQRKDELWSRIKSETLKADVVIITHYHYDHHNPKEPDILSDKTLLIKDPKQAINFSQMNRASYFLNLLKNLTHKPNIMSADGKSFEFGNTSIVFSKPVPHGKDTKLGYVLEVLVEERKKFLFTSDVEGIVTADQLEFVLESNPDVIFLDGPMTYMPHVFGVKVVKKSIDNLITVMEKTEVKEIVVDHHLTRDLNWKIKIDTVLAKANELGVKIKSASEFAGSEENLLEARRKELYQKSVF
jgi:predicted metallo-beta-lactamase superfamily hydrolase